ncbi:LysR family transcriptional regulator [Moritella marina ATCC 15381]|uniref:LysR family transcriptional regulator n=1 Tax=Moritella marina ATCC 15381 TaxID=1202962 RepID=A0A5J6WN69_MORMI|nr:LysR family transcriptional regulator [Moritella marina]QFI39583.1 LysR family transcriptional regulator [Moritella marina ATCC 15381]
MRLIQIEMFLLAVKTGSISEAAIQLGKSRSTVSAALLALEDELGVNLLLRSGNKIELSHIGENIVADCQRIYHLSQGVHAKCAHHLAGAESALRIARDDALPEKFWNQLISQLEKKFPQTSLSMYAAPTPELIAYVENNKVDIAYGMISDTHDYQRHVRNELGQLRMMAVAAADHPLHTIGNRLTSNDLALYTEVVLAYMDDLLTVEASISHRYIGLTFYEYLRDAVCNGVGWAKVPAPLITDQLRNETLKVLRYKKSMSWEIYGEITGVDFCRGAVTDWIAEQIEHYLITESH